MTTFAIGSTLTCQHDLKLPYPLQQTNLFSMEYRENEQLRLATEFVQFTNKNIFITGRAGTGKTTFLHNLKKITPKRMVVVAPTGVAAINAGGVTIHSFFQLNFAPAIPEVLREKKAGKLAEGYQHKFSRNKIKLIKCIDLLVIDEISMVRADILDAVDEVLRRYRNRTKPFGGVQLLMIGDLHQLTPVIKDDEWKILKDYYDSIYFFDSFALKKSQPISIELKEIFRQTDQYFIGLLNKVRDNNINLDTIAEINTRHIPGFRPKDEEGYITLTTHNANANGLNQAKLKEIKDISHFFYADIEGEFSPNDFPTDEKLELKVGSQVMFIKNDPSPEKLYYNGKIGKIVRMDDDVVFVKCPSDNSEIEVGKVVWENVRYSLNDNTREVDEKVIGTFSQIPLRLAWAITIHKSQGLTFDKVIIDAHAAFAFGQVYVALSRCRTFEGIVLSTPISVAGIKTDALVAEYTEDVRQNEPGPEKLQEARKLFQHDLIIELFDFNLLRYRFDDLLKLIRENARLLEASKVIELEEKRRLFDAELLQVAEKFKQQLRHIMQQAVLPQENPTLQERIRKASQYFSDSIKTKLSDYLDTTFFDTDNKAIKNDLAESLEKMQKEVFIKYSCIKNARDGFDTILYLRQRSDAEVDFRPPKHKTALQPVASAQSKHPVLYQALKQWRNNLAEENNMPVYQILPQKTIIELVNKLPTSLPALKTIKGIGKVKSEMYGPEIISMILEYCRDHDIVAEQIEISVKVKQEKIPSRNISMDLFKAGKNIAEIAKERGVSVSTIEGHLAYFVGRGMLDVKLFVDEEKIKKVLPLLGSDNHKSLSEIKAKLGDEISYNELNFIVQHYKHLQEE